MTSPIAHGSPRRADLERFEYREWKYDERREHESRLHPTFIHKPVNMLQKQLNLSKLEDGDYKAAKTQATISDKIRLEQTDKPIPVAWDEEYNPSDRSSDWSGLVKKRPHKKAVSREIDPNKPIDDLDYNKPKARNPYAPEDTCSLIAGIASADPYKTSTQRLFANEPTRAVDKKKPVGGGANQHNTNNKNPPLVVEDIDTPRATPREDLNSVLSSQGSRVRVGSSSNINSNNNGDENEKEKSIIRTPKVNTMLSSMGSDMIKSATRFAPEIEVSVNRPKVVAPYRRDGIKFG